MAVSSVPQSWKIPAGRTLGSLIAVSVALTVNALAKEGLDSLGARWRLPSGTLTTTHRIAAVTVLLLTILTIMQIWGLPVASALALLLLIAIVVPVFFRDEAIDLLAGFRLSIAHQVRAGDYVKLATGEQGQVFELGRSSTTIKKIDGSTLIVPNRTLVHENLINHGQAAKKAAEPFRFYGSLQITEPTGLMARNLQELSATLKTVPISVVNYHTHHFLLQHQYLSPEPANDFGHWVSDALGNEMVGESLASVDTYEFGNLEDLRQRLVGIMDECNARGIAGHNAAEGREFFFLKAVTVVFPLPYVAYDLRQFIEALKNVSPGSLFYHVFESKLRLGQGLNDFSAWLEKQLGEQELAASVARVNPYTYTLGGLRTYLIHLLEKRLE